LSKKLAFSWTLHQHQPVGNFPWVFAQVYDACYAPLVDALERHPTIQVALHYSGPLLDWLLAEHPDYIERVAALVGRGQVEMLTGGYYEPILPSIPELDQYGQIMKMNAAIRQHFGTDPTGLWLTERVWEPNLPTVLNKAGVHYTLLDDTHFLMAGLRPNDLFGYYLTEDQGNPLVVFPSSKSLRETIPFRAVATAEAEFRRLAVEAAGEPYLILMADDGEKFGSWPNTYERVWRQGYMEEFLTMLERNADWLETITPGAYIQREAALGRLYIPAASYAEMMEWALPTERQVVFEQVRRSLEHERASDILGFLRGGIWRNFAAKYPEANNFHKKMLRVQSKVRHLTTLLGPYKTLEALDQVWQGQCNCGYWHGVFGGLYIADIRSAIYQHLIRAEVIADSALSASDPTVSLVDFDCDGRDELLIEGPLMDVYIAPYDGGSIFEWDWKETPFNVVDTLARRPEAYHQRLKTGRVRVVPQRAPAEILEDQHAYSESSESIHDIVQAKESGLEHLLHYDLTRRTALRERFFSEATTWQDLAAMRYAELSDFPAGAFEHRVEGVGVDALVVDLWRDGSVRVSGREASLRLRKVITVANDAPELRVNYTLHNTSKRHIRSRFGIEGNWGMLGGGGNPAAWYVFDGHCSGDHPALDASGVSESVQSVALINSGVGVKVTLYPGTPAALWYFPVETVSNSESGFERSYQCSCTVLHWPIDIAPGDRWSVTLRLSLSRSPARS
jgi:4-alpha-glucanotransferase